MSGVLLQKVQKMTDLVLEQKLTEKYLTFVRTSATTSTQQMLLLQAMNISTLPQKMMTISISGSWDFSGHTHSKKKSLS